eukprot:CAMPEP_0173472922 /NCGR_PEP_ID=MMETSP1357-20121228/79144_1 /TAXON_ID=77926 /ORGANISM="Hemiselmis rufescens, Strain PCC563" /LENGTH=54 /DNA_ID=CAMNT_0014441247 /DNA_START=908 /DNA_END=1069 /DNA_ORIENTATION=-
MKVSTVIVQCSSNLACPSTLRSSLTLYCNIASFPPPPASFTSFNKQTHAASCRL